MSSFPTEQDMLVIHEKVAELIGHPPCLADPDMLRAVILGIRLSRRGGEIHRGRFERAAALIQEVVERRPFAAGNAATGLAGALLYLSRHDTRIRFEAGQASALVDGARTGSLDEQRLAALLRLRAVTGRTAKA